jgi:hypothetical protein
MSRSFSPWTGDGEQRHLQQLLEAVGDPTAYRAAMCALGRDLGRELKRRLPPGEVDLACTVEDADFLAHGVLDELEPTHRTHLVVFWNERQRIGAQELAPVIARYEERLEREKIGALVVLESIISGACVVRTNLLEMLERIHDSVPIFVAAPVLHAEAWSRLSREFPPEVLRRMVSVWCAQDTEKRDDAVVPGIGGVVYGLLGLGSEQEKNRFRPQLLDARRARLAV